MAGIETWPPERFAGKLDQVMRYSILGLAGSPDVEAVTILLHQHAEAVLRELATVVRRTTGRPLDPAIMAAAADVAGARAVADWHRIRVAAGSSAEGGHA